MKIGRPATPAIERFWAMVERTIGCWTWTGPITSDGYGKIYVAGRQVVAHRFAFELLREAIPEGLQLDHLCRNRACVNPDHLEPVTCRENLLRGETIAAREAGKTHCVHGHPFDAANTNIRPGGGRECRTCGREKRRRLKARAAA